MGGKTLGSKLAEVSRNKGEGREGRPQAIRGHLRLLSPRIQQLPLTSCQGPGPADNMTLWKFSILAVSFISLSFFLRDNTNRRLEYSVSLVSSRK